MTSLRGCGRSCDGGGRLRQPVRSPMATSQVTYGNQSGHLWQPVRSPVATSRLDSAFSRIVSEYESGRLGIASGSRRPARTGVSGNVYGRLFHSVRSPRTDGALGSASSRLGSASSRLVRAPRLLVATHSPARLRDASAPIEATS